MEVYRDFCNVTCFCVVLSLLDSLIVSCLDFLADHSDRWSTCKFITLLLAYHHLDLVQIITLTGYLQIEYRNCLFDIRCCGVKYFYLSVVVCYRCFWCLGCYIWLFLECMATAIVMDGFFYDAGFHHKNCVNMKSLIRRAF